MDLRERAESGGVPGTAYPATLRVWRRAALALTLLFVLAAIAVSTGLVVHTAWNHELENGLFALLFAVLSAKAALLWLAWSDQPDSHQPSAVSKNRARARFDELAASGLYDSLERDLRTRGKERDV